MRKFTDIFSDETKYGCKIPTSEYLENGLYPIIDQGKKFISGYRDNEEGIYKNVPAIIFGDHTRILKYIDVPFFIGADGVKILKSRNDKYNYKYLFYALKNIDIPDTGYNRHFKWLKEATINTPDLQTQEYIVDILDRVYDLIQLREQQLSKLDQLVKSRFIEMFGDPVQNEKKWPVVPLEEVAEIRIGPFGSLLHKEDYIEGGHALVNPSHIVEGKICIDSQLTVSPEKYQELNAYHLEEEDIVLGRRGEMGRCAVVHSAGLLCGTGSMIVRPNKKMKSYFLQTILSSPTYKKTIEDKAVGVTMMNLNVPIVSALPVPLLPLDLQEEFIALLQKVDKSKSAVKQSLEKLETLKKSLMQEYFG